jgi:lactam utilization protein B
MHDRKFEVRCDATPDGQLHVRSRSLSVAVSQSIEANKSEELWQSVLVICEQGEDGALTTKVIVCHPDWDQNLQIACIRSTPSDQRRPAAPSIEIDLKTTHV